MSCPINAISPTPAIVAPARRGAMAETSAPRLRAIAATPVLSAL
jgi:hypothetical protein